MSRVVIILGALLAVGAISWYFPLFHVVSRDGLRVEREKREFHAAEYVKEFWAKKLAPALPDAMDTATVLTALRANPELARSQYGRVTGLGRSSLYFLRGSGTIVSVDDKQISVSLADKAGDTDIVLVTGLLFGNTVRDATGLLRGDDFSNSQQFNEVSTELNRIIEATVLPTFRTRAKVGDVVEFVGCAEVTNMPRDVDPLRVIPIDVKFK